MWPLVAIDARHPQLARDGVVVVVGGVSSEGAAGLDVPMIGSMVRWSHFLLEGGGVNRVF